MKNATQIKLFIFEPHEWSYCGGAIGVIAKNFEQAVKLLVEKDIEKAKKTLQEFKKTSTLPIDEQEFRIYRTNFFQRNPANFENILYNRWLLTHEITILEDGLPNPRILFDNWNEA